MPIGWRFTVQTSGCRTRGRWARVLFDNHLIAVAMPHTRAMGKGLFELRLKAQEGIARLFYCLAIGRRIVILHSFVKKSQKTPARELAIALRRMKEMESC